VSPSCLRRSVTLLVTVILALPAAGCSSTVTPGGDSPLRTGTGAGPSATTIEPTSAPSATGPLTTGEVAWLDALAALQQRMAAVTANKITELTPQTAARKANELRGCSVELARAGSPGARLKPAYQLAKTGCEAFDRGAGCLVTAASIRFALPLTPSSRKRAESIDCANVSVREGRSNLGNARMEGETIRVENG
jgi:hypothetical protein